jgi:hypothetical protein
MQKEEAVAFFSDVFGGEHHIPGTVHPFGQGWSVAGLLLAATYDGDLLTRMVVLAHDRCVRLEIRAYHPQSLQIAIHKRSAREGRMFDRHPTLEAAVARLRGNPE